MQQPALDGGLWNGRKVADWLSEKMGFPVSRQRGWQYLQQIGFRLKTPRPSHTDSDFSQQLLQGKKTRSRVSKASN